MRTFAYIVFIIHVVFELIFGASAFLSGASSSQSAEQIAQQSVQVTIAFRFLGSALLALGVLGAVVVFVAGVQSATAKYIAIGFAAFHGLGAVGSLWSAAPTFEVYSQPLALGALVLHGLLALGFAAVALLMKTEDRASR
ncbi:hypothetical protein [Bauldia sp.]|uniref:hypothetical protein n=1 Tax=Bauldia sp. TaxID=2575872 RepID=UPI003BAD4901